MLVADLQRLIEGMAPTALAQADDNSGLLIGDDTAEVQKVLAALELTGPVLDEAVSGGYETLLTHHPFLFSPLHSLVESHWREALVRRVVREGITLICCHTNLDAAAGGLAEIAGEALGLAEMAPLEHSKAGWYKLVGFVPDEVVEAVSAAVFAAGAGGIGQYRDCAFAAEGVGWFTPGPGSNPAIGQESRPERTREMRWETVVPHGRLGAVVRAFVSAHPYEEPAFDVYPLDDVLPKVGLGRVGSLSKPLSVKALAERARETFEVSGVAWCGDGRRLVTRVGVLPGSGRSLVEVAADLCEVLVTGDLGYHDAERAQERGLSLVDVPHGEFEWWAFKRWTTILTERLDSAGVRLAVSERWRPAWERAASGDGGSGGAAGEEERVAGALRLWIDGGSRGNPGESAIGVVVKDAAGSVLRTVSRAIGVTTNNVAEYQAVIAALEVAEEMGAREIEVASDSELLVKQMHGEYKVKNEGLKPLYAEACERGAGFRHFAIRHVPREENVEADSLVNRALDEQETAGL